jgi:hypothetical protein
MTLPTPIVGEWYQGVDGELFEVVAIDPDEQTIDVQHFDGTLEEFDPDAWIQRAPREADAPEDWTGSVDVEPEDHEDDVYLVPPPVWAAPLEYLDRDEAAGYSEWPAPAG